MRPSNADLKRALRARFPAVKFSVHSGRGTGASWTHVDWADGPSERAVTAALAELGAAPGTMDQSDYFNGERISATRHVSDAHRARVAALLLAPQDVPPADVWGWNVRRSNAGGYYNLHDVVHRACARRDDFERHQFDAHAWLAAYRDQTHDAPTSVNYEQREPLTLVAL